MNKKDRQFIENMIKIEERAFKEAKELAHNINKERREKMIKEAPIVYSPNGFESLESNTECKTIQTQKPFTKGKLVSSA